MATNTYSPQTLQDQLDRIKQQRVLAYRNRPEDPIGAPARDYRETPTFKTFAPKEMDTQLSETPFYENIADAISQADNAATATEIIKARNRYNYEQFQKAQAELEKARKQQVKRGPGIQMPKLNQGHSADDGHGHAPKQEQSFTPGALPSSGTSYYTSTPSWLNINAGMTTFQAAGRTWTLNKSVAGRFRGFINELTGRYGYKIRMHGSYANRNQASGSGMKSLHAYGLAIDVNWDKNSFSGWGQGRRHDFGKIPISRLAKKYGLVWGGDWKRSYDYMHFSVPYGGRL